jgi:hypothetical protein
MWTWIRRGGGVLVLGALTIAAVPAVEADLRDDLRNAPAIVEVDPTALGPGYRNAVDALVDSAPRALPIPAASGAFTYRYDDATGEYERTSETFGPMLFMERPQTLGRQVWRIGVSGQYLELDEFDGKSIGRDPDPIIVPGRSGPIRFFATPKFIYHLATVNVTYGLLDDLDLNVAVPFGASDFDTTASLVDENGNFFFNTQHSKESVTVGDVLLRAKYRLCEWQGVTAAAGLNARLPSGDSDNAWGTGTFGLGPALAASMLLWDRVEPQWNGGFDFDVEESHRSSAHYAFGVNVQAVKEWLDLGVSFLGRSDVDGLRSDRSVSGLHQTAAGPLLRPYEGFNFDRKDYFDFSGGARVRVYKTLMITLSATKGLNDDGLRSSNWSPVGALEATF